MATGKENLIHLSERSKEERKRIAKKGGKASVEARRRRKAFREIFDAVLKDKSPKDHDGKKLNNAEAMVYKLIKKAINGDVKAFEIIRDTVGEKPTDNLNLSGGVTTLLKDDVNE